MAGRSSHSTEVTKSNLTLPTHAAHVGDRSSKKVKFSAEGGAVLERTGTHHTHRSSASGIASRTPKWWKIRVFQGMINDLRRRVPFYWSDWKDAWDYRVVPATIYMYFAKYAVTQANYKVFFSLIPASFVALNTTTL